MVCTTEAQETQRTGAGPAADPSSLSSLRLRDPPYEREPQTRKFGMLAIQQSMGSKMYDAILLQRCTGCGGTAGIKIERLHSFARGRNRENGLRFTAGVGQTRKMEFAAGLCPEISQGASQSSIDLGIFASG